MTMRFQTSLALSLCVATIGGAQQTKAPARGSGSFAVCRVDSSAAWFKRQRTWFGETPQKWSNDTLRTALMRAAGLNASSAVDVQWGWAVVGETHSGAADSAAVAGLLNLSRTRGSTWPTKSVVGAAGTHAVALLALRDTTLGRTALRRMMEAGPDESPPADVATLEDRIRLISGRKQIYGTQFQRTEKGLVLAPMEDSAHVDLRREDAGLPPFKLSACLARAAAPRP
jgi:hypothetical protein